MYVLDTNTLIYFFKGMGNVSRFLLSKPPKGIAIPTIVLYELHVGIEKSISPEKRLSQWQAFTSSINILPFGVEEARWAAHIRANLEKQRTPIRPNDILIAATALAQNGILVTHNTREFERITDLKIEDWY